LASRARADQQSLQNSEQQLSAALQQVKGLITLDTLIPTAFLVRNLF
jgi:hypothetical protein